MISKFRPLAAALPIVAALSLLPPAEAAPKGRAAQISRASSTFRIETTGYLDYAAFSSQLERVIGGSRIAKKISLGKTLGGRDIWVVALGADAALLSPPTGHVGEIRDTGTKFPGLLVVGGVDASQLAGSEEALRFIGRMVADYGKVDSVTALLDRTTIYVAPRVSPDACEHYFEKPVALRTTNNNPSDDDRDGRVDEDGPRDLNGDGMISVMRVEDPEGEWLPNPADPRLLKRADRVKGEVGRYKIYTEGHDLDGDGDFAEDGPGGVDFSRSWPHGYKYFASGAGKDPMTELENRALADFMYDHANIAAVFVFGAEDNLMKPWKADPSQAGIYGRAVATSSGARDDDDNYGGNTGGLTATARTGRQRGAPRNNDAPVPDPRITAPPSGDAETYEFLSKRYTELTGFKDAPEAAPGEGDLGSFAYYDFGRWALTARAWWPTPLDTAKADTSRGAAHSEGGAMGATPGAAAPPGGPAGGMRRGGRRGGGGDGAPKDGEDDGEMKDLKALESRGIDALLPWTPIEGPDFPGQKVEVGGFRPYVRTVPPAALLDSLAEKSSRFLADLAGRLPRVEIRGARAEKLGGGASRVTVDVADTGYLPSVSQMGEVCRWPRDIRVRTTGGRLLSGHELTLLAPLAGSGGFKTLSWVVEGSGETMTITADSPTCGAARVEVRLP